MTTQSPQRQQEPQSLKMVLTNESVQKRIQQVLGDRAPQFCSSIVSLVSANDRLAKAEPQSIIAACMTAALLNLPISKDLGFAHIIPYSGVAQFQMGYKGFVQLAMRTGQYRHLNTCQVFEGELVKYDRLSGELVLDETKRASDTVVGWAAYMELINGFKHALYWTDEEVQQHAQRFSQAVKSKKTDSPWFTNRDAMCLKTVLKALLSKWGILSVELERALHEDQGVKRDIDADTEFLDNNRGAPSGDIPAPKADDAKLDPVATDEIQLTDENKEEFVNKAFAECTAGDIEAACRDLIKPAKGKKVTPLMVAGKSLEQVTEFLNRLDALAEERRQAGPSLAIMELYSTLTPDEQLQVKSACGAESVDVTHVLATGEHEQLLEYVQKLLAKRAKK